MIEWRGRWKAFDLSEKESDFLREIESETGDSNPTHPLHGKVRLIIGCRIIGLDGSSWKDLMLYLPGEDHYAYIHLTWSKESDPLWPHCEFFDNIDEVNRWLRGELALGRER